jgi:hypothetical protein
VVAAQTHYGGLSGTAAAEIKSFKGFRLLAEWSIFITIVQKTNKITIATDETSFGHLPGRYRCGDRQIVNGHFHSYLENLLKCYGGYKTSYANMFYDYCCLKVDPGDPQVRPYMIRTGSYRSSGYCRIFFFYGNHQPW